MSERETEFSAFERLAEHLLWWIRKKNHPTDDSGEHGYDAKIILALYMAGKISRYAVTKHFASQWTWHKPIDEFDLIDIFDEIEKYKPDYKGVYDVKTTDVKSGTN